MEKLDREDIISLAKEKLDKCNYVTLDEIIETIEQIAAKHHYVDIQEFDYAIKVLSSKYCK